jgi:PKD repeat protein
MRELLITPCLVLLTATATLAQSYSHTLAFSGSGLNSWTSFTFPNTPATFGGATLTFGWLACYNTGSGSSIQIQFQTGASTYVTVYSENGNTSSCATLQRSTAITANQLSAARAFTGGNSVQGRVQILDGCAPGIGCFVNDPMLTSFRLQYTVESAHFTSPDATICPGEVVQFNNASLGSPTAFEWNFPGGVPAASTLTNPVVQYPTAGQYDVTLTIANAEGTSTATRTNFVTVHPLPDAFAGVDQSFCAGGSAQLQATGGGTYQWIPTTGLSNPAIANPVASPASNTTYTVIVTSAQGCTASDAVQVTVAPAPTILLSENDPVLCGNETLTITASGADLYSWSPNLFISSASGATVEVFPPSDFSWTVTGTTTIGCMGQTTVNVTVVPAPAPPTITWADMVLSTGAAASYQWYLDGEAISGATAQTWTPTVNGMYTVEVTDANGCSATSAPYLFSSTGVDVAIVDDIRVHPQPARELLHVSGVAPGTPYRMIDMQGRTVAEGVLQQVPHAIHTAHLAPGMHVLMLGYGNAVRRLPVVVE